MYHLDGQAFLLDIRFLVHQTSHISRDNVLSTRVHRIFHLMARHTHSQRLVVDFQRKIGTTAHVGLLHLHQFQSPYLGEQLTRLLAKTQPSQGTATVMKRYFIREFRTEIIKIHLVDQKIGQLVDISHHPLEIQVVGRIEK